MPPFTQDGSGGGKEILFARIKKVNQPILKVQLGHFVRNWKRVEGRGEEKREREKSKNKNWSTKRHLKWKKEIKQVYGVSGWKTQMVAGLARSLCQHKSLFVLHTTSPIIPSISLTRARMAQRDTQAQRCRTISNGKQTQISNRNSFPTVHATEFPWNRAGWPVPWLDELRAVQVSQYLSLSSPPSLRAPTNSCWWRFWWNIDSQGGSTQENPERIFSLYLFPPPPIFCSETSFFLCLNSSFAPFSRERILLIKSNCILNPHLKHTLSLSHFGIPYFQPHAPKLHQIVLFFQCKFCQEIFPSSGLPLQHPLLSPESWQNFQLILGIFFCLVVNLFSELWSPEWKQPLSSSSIFQQHSLTGYFSINRLISQPHPHSTPIPHTVTDYKQKKQSDVSFVSSPLPNSQHKKNQSRKYHHEQFFWLFSSHAQIFHQVKNGHFPHLAFPVGDKKKKHQEKRGKIVKAPSCALCSMCCLCLRRGLKYILVRGEAFLQIIDIVLNFFLLLSKNIRQMQISVGDA